MLGLAHEYLQLLLIYSCYLSTSCFFLSTHAMVHSGLVGVGVWSVAVSELPAGGLFGHLSTFPQTMFIC
jgi:hypothetical protein